MISFGKKGLFFAGAVCLCFLNIKLAIAKHNVDARKNSCEWTSTEFLDINKAFMIALSENPTVSKFVSRIEQAKQRVFQAKSYYLPSINFEGTLGRGNDFKNDQESADIYQLRVGARWLFFDGFERKFKNIIAEYGEQASTAAFDDARRCLLMSVSKKFYDAQLFRENINIAIANEVFTSRQLKEAEAKFSVGTGSLSEILNFKNRLNKARLIVKNEQNRYKVAMLNLGSLLGISDFNFVSDVKLAPFSPETYEELIPPNWDNILEDNIKKRPDISVLTLVAKQANANVYANESANYPKFFVSASINAKKIGNMHFCGDDISSDLSIGIFYNLFSGGLHMAKIREAKEKENEIRSEIRKVLISAKVEIKAAVLRVLNAQTRVVLQRKNNELIERTRNLVEKEYKESHSSLVRLNEVQNELISSRSQLVLAVLNLREAWMNLNVLTGQINY